MTFCQPQRNEPWFTAQTCSIPFMNLTNTSLQRPRTPQKAVWLLKAFTLRLLCSGLIDYLIDHLQPFLTAKVNKPVYYDTCCRQLPDGWLNILTREILIPFTKSKLSLRRTEFLTSRFAWRKVLKSTQSYSFSCKGPMHTSTALKDCCNKNLVVNLMLNQERFTVLKLICHTMHWEVSSVCLDFIVAIHQSCRYVWKS